MGLDRRSKPDDTCWAKHHIMDEGKPEKCGKEGSRYHRSQIVRKEKERSKQGEKTPDRSESDPA